MHSDPKIDLSEPAGNFRFGLCMFVPAIMAPAANRLLCLAYGSAGDNLSVPMRRIGTGNQVHYLAGNHTTADTLLTKRTIEVLERIPGAVMLIAEAGVGGRSAQTLGLLENGRTQKFEGGTHSFFSFAADHLYIERVDHPADAIDEFQDFGVTLQAQLLTSESQPRVLLRTPWEAIFYEIIQDPSSLYRFKKNPRAFEEFIAETYRLDGYEVELTPRSNDGGVDVIAKKIGFGAIKILDQAKAYSESRRVSANDVRAAFGVLASTADASKVIVTTTSEFAPGVYQEFARFMPTRLDLRQGQDLIDWLKHVDMNLPPSR